MCHPLITLPICQVMPWLFIIRRLAARTSSAQLEIVSYNKVSSINSCFRQILTFTSVSLCLPDCHPQLCGMQVRQCCEELLTTFNRLGLYIYLVFTEPYWRSLRSARAASDSEVNPYSLGEFLLAFVQLKKLAVSLLIRSIAVTLDLPKVHSYLFGWSFY